MESWAIIDLLGAATNLRSRLLTCGREWGRSKVARTEMGSEGSKRGVHWMNALDRPRAALTGAVAILPPSRSFGGRPDAPQAASAGRIGRAGRTPTIERGIGDAERRAAPATGDGPARLWMPV
jgi:hypothetical protein